MRLPFHASHVSPPLHARFAAATPLASRGQLRRFESRHGRFMQVDPVGYDDQLNLYSYVGNDPTNGTDPDGRYACGKMSGAQCDSFKVAQNRAIGQVKQEVGALKSLQSALKGGGKLTGEQKGLQARLEKFVGRGAGSSQSAISGLIRTGGAMLSALQGNKAFSLGRSSGAEYASVGRFSGTLRPAFFASSAFQQVQTVAHEAAHDAGAKDRQTGSIGAYGERNALRWARYGAHYSMRNADNVTFALGFERDDDE